MNGTEILLTFLLIAAVTGWLAFALACLRVAETKVHLDYMNRQWASMRADREALLAKLYDVTVHLDECGTVLEEARHILKAGK